MKTLMFSLYDVKLEGFLRPFCLQTLAVARRAILDIQKDPKHEATLHPEDFCLYQLGTFDDHSSEILQMLPPKRIGLVSEIVANYDLESVRPKDYAHGEATVGNEAPVLRSATRGDSTQ